LRYAALLGKYRLTLATVVAAALVACCKRPEPEPGAHVIEAPAIHRFAR